MNKQDIEDIVSQAQQEQQSVTDLAQETVEWFISDERVGNAYPIEEATQELSEHLNTSYHEASRAISSVVGDIVDPVQLITLSDGKYVGVFEYNVYSGSGAYGYIHYDDRFGKLKRVVCAKCVQDHILDENVTHATQGMGTSSGEASWSDLVGKIEQHYDNAHEAHPEDIEPGAALVSGTTISGNTAFHTGNESSITHDNISGGTSGNPHADSLSTSYSAPVQSVNSQTGDVTISAIGGSVTNYSDLSFNLSERQFYYVSSEQDIVVQTDANLDIWKSISDFTPVASNIPDTSMFQNPIYQWWAGSIGEADGTSPVNWPESLAGLTDATAVGSPTKTTQSGFEAVRYDPSDGDNDGHNWSPNSSLPTGSDSVSVAATVYANATSGEAILSYGNATNGNGMVFFLSNGNVRANVEGNTANAEGTTTISTGQWVTVGFSMATDDLKVILNGSVDGSDSNASFNLGDANHTLGYRGYKNDFYADLFVYEIVLCAGNETNTAHSEYHTDRLG